MTGAHLLAQLRERGACVELIGGRLRVHPRSRVHDLEALVRRHVESVVRALEAEARHFPPREESEGSEETSPAETVGHLSPLTSLTSQLRERYADLDAADRTRLRAEAASGDALAGTVLRLVATDSDAEVIAWRLDSRRLGGELWLVRDLAALAQLEHDHVLDGLPVVLGDELGDLAGLDDDTLRALLEAKRLFGATTRAVDMPDEERAPWH
jgi:hypothetical protein